MVAFSITELVRDGPKLGSLYVECYGMTFGKML